MYFITCVEKLEINERGWPENGSVRTFGFFEEKNKAFQAVKENWCDLHECLYTYAIVEYITEGIHSFCEERWFFEYNFETRGFDEIKEPEGYKTFTNFAIG